MFGIFWSIILSILIGGVAVVYWFSKTQNYWRDKGFEFIAAGEIGNGIVDVFKSIHVAELDSKLYNVMKIKGLPFAGFMELTQPTIFIRDIELMRNVFVKDFDHFVNRRNFRSDADFWTQRMLFFMESEPWRDLRAKMSPTFTTGKIRRMFDIIDACSDRLVQLLEEKIKEAPTINFGEGFGKYTVDVISSAVFGIESGAFRETKSIFEKMGERLQINSSFKDILKIITITLAPKQVTNILKLQLFDKEACEFFQQIIQKAIKHRQASGEKREDFLQVMLEARSGQLKSEEIPLDVFEKEAAINSSSKGIVDLSDDVICAQSIIFFLAGFETTQTLLHFAAYQLAVCPDVQEKLAAEVKESFKQNGNKFTYESINEMEYMDKFISETLRMYPPVPRLERRCTLPYPIPDSNLVIPADTLVCIPTYAIHYDQEIFPDPLKFNPERFSKEGKAERSPYVFMPFGHGPRNCIGMRFALTESKIAIAKLLMKFVFEPSDQTPIPMTFSKISNFNLRPEGGTFLNLKPRVF